MYSDRDIDRVIERQAEKEGRIIGIGTERHRNTVTGDGRTVADKQTDRDVHTI